ncbi:Retrovirus-related Pol polyprotein from transposon TNT 1-94 [Lasiodiplodia theobromae]|uniref:Retrovirus-related Pol polyprotein from transposon TNT 1-94 n=1 Tax=Lasiodiplodia theobromae TaxID=45133 RepID=A0A5N5CTC0_9PEZI|nr:Retrovirus-related Pol polyprotein from transposon TNT 1-94 [Lasiodiplodia theobromae]
MTESSTRELGTVPKLISSRNYLQWRSLLEGYFKREDLWEIVNGDLAQPPKQERLKPEEEDALDETALAKYERKLKRYKDWITRDAKAIYAIKMTIHMDYLRSLSTFSTSKGMWDDINSKFEGEGPVQQSIYFSIWTKMTYDPTTNLETFLRKYSAAWTDCIQSGLKLPPETAVYELLAKLDQHFDAWVTAKRQSLRNKEEIKLQDLINQIIDENKRNMLLPNAQVNVLRGRVKPNQSNVSNQPNRQKCLCCNGSHLTERCFHLHPELSRGGSFVPNQKLVSEYHASQSKDQPTAYHSTKSDAKSGALNHMAIMQLPLAIPKKTKEWFHDHFIVDTGAYYHCCNNRRAFLDLQDTLPSEISTGGGPIKVLGRGTIQLSFLDSKNDKITRTIQHVLFTPDLPISTISSRIFYERKGNQLFFHGSDKPGFYTPSGEEIMYTPYKRELGFFSPQILAIGSNPEAQRRQLLLPVSPIKIDINLLHQRMGHASFQACLLLAQQLGFRTTGQQTYCETCALTKSQRKISYEKQRRASEPGEFHVDTVQMSTPGMHGERYFLLATDDATAFRWGYPFKKKYHAFDTLKDHIEMWNTQTGSYPKRIRIDDGREFAMNQLRAYCSAKGIKLEISAPYTPEQNGKAEKANHIIETRIRSMLQGARLSSFLWPETLNTAIKIVNRTPTRINKDSKTPYQSLCEKLGMSDTLPNITNWRTFGCTAYAHVPRQRRTQGNKLELRAQKGNLIGYEGDAIYRIYLPSKRTVIRSSHVTFNESNLDLPNVPNEDLLDEDDPTIEINDLPPEPRDWTEAVNHPLKDHWIQAANKEINQHQKNGTWIVTRPPAFARVLPCTWVFKYKADSTGNLASCKARLCVRGDKQRPGLDYVETFASVVKPAAFKIIMALITLLDLECHQLDISSAFINGKIDKDDVYMTLPPGFTTQTNGTNLVVHLQKALYGLKQAPRIWQQEITGFLSTIEYFPLDSDPCVFQHAQSKGVIIVYVDDLILIHKGMEAINIMKAQLSSKYELHDLGPIHHYLGMKITRDRLSKTMWISQESYIQRILSKHHMQDCKPISTPMEPSGASLAPRAEGQASTNLINEYQSLIGSIGYAANMTRADITYATHKLCQFTHNPSESHLNAAYRILRYLKGNPDYSIKFSASTDGELHLQAYSDAAYADNKDNRASTQGYAFLAAGGLVSFKSTKQSNVATSSTEAEYVAMTLAAKEALWIKHLLNEIGYHGSDLSPIQLYGDNQPAISLTRPDRKDNSRIKHIETQYHFVRQQVEKGKIELNYIPTDHMLADILTKPLPKLKFQRFIPKIGLCKRPSL